MRESTRNENIRQQEHLAELTRRAVEGAAILCESRPTLALLGRVVGVGRSQARRWATGMAYRPRESRCEKLRVLAELYAEVESAKKKAKAKLECLWFMEL